MSKQNQVEGFTRVKPYKPRDKTRCNHASQMIINSSSQLLSFPGPLVGDEKNCRKKLFFFPLSVSRSVYFYLEQVGLGLSFALQLDQFSFVSRR